MTTLLWHGICIVVQICWDGFALCVSNEKECLTMHGMFVGSSHVIFQRSLNTDMLEEMWKNRMNNTYKTN